MPLGTVKFFRDKLGWGFIERDDGSDVFVYYKDIRGDGHKTLEKGDKVEFDVVDSPRGEKAVNVMRIGNNMVE